MNVRALAAEAIGTFILVFFGSLGVATVFVITSGQGSPIVALLTVPFAFGLGLMAAIAIGGGTSGGHFNPAVTLAALFDGRLGPVAAVGYVIAQIIGALAASLAILVITSVDIVKMSVNLPGPTAPDAFGQEIHAFAAEAILTAIFVAVILSVTRRAPESAIFVIPLTLAVIHFAAMHISGASVNPARSLAPAIVSGTYTSLWVYLTAPFAGSIVGWGVYRLFNEPDEDQDATADDSLEDVLGDGDEYEDEDEYEDDATGEDSTR
jgi:aquaporin Z